MKMMKICILAQLQWLICILAQSNVENRVLVQANMSKSIKREDDHEWLKLTATIKKTRRS